MENAQLLHMKYQTGDRERTHATSAQKSTECTLYNEIYK